MWKVVRDATLAKYFELENIWQKEWRPTSDVAVISNYWNDGDERDLVLQIWETHIHGKSKTFAAGEAGGMERWVFALPSSKI